MSSKTPIELVLQIHPQNDLFPGGAEKIAAAVSAALMGPATDCRVIIQRGNQLVCVREHHDG